MKPYAVGQPPDRSIHTRWEAIIREMSWFGCNFRTSTNAERTASNTVSLMGGTAAGLDKSCVMDAAKAGGRTGSTHRGPGCLRHPHRRPREPRPVQAVPLAVQPGASRRHPVRGQRRHVGELRGRAQCGAHRALTVRRHLHASMYGISEEAKSLTIRQDSRSTMEHVSALMSGPHPWLSATECRLPHVAQ